MSRRPLVLVDHDLDVVVSLAHAQGWTADELQVRRLLGPPDVADAVEAVVAGAGLVADVAALDDRLLAGLCDDLRRFGEVRLVRRAGAEPGEVADVEGAAVLDLLAAGHSLGAAARFLHLSRRSADRRLAAARAALGVTTTLEAVSRSRSRALVDPAPDAQRRRARSSSSAESGTSRSPRPTPTERSGL